MGKVIDLNSKRKLTIEQLGLEDLCLGFIASDTKLRHVNDVVNVAANLIFEFDEEDCLALIFLTNSIGQEVVHLIDKQHSVIFSLPRVDCIETIRDIVIATGIGHLLILEQLGENEYQFVY